jgi:hypothetical protein
MIPPPGASRAEDRKRVLKHPDLAARLCEPPLGFSRPEQWMGYIPPDTCGQQLNLSPCRDALLAIATAAYERERDGCWQTPLTEPDTDLEQDSNE